MILRVLPQPFPPTALAENPRSKYSNFRDTTVGLRCAVSLTMGTFMYFMDRKDETSIVQKKKAMGNHRMAVTMLNGSYCTHPFIREHSTKTTATMHCACSVVSSIVVVATLYWRRFRPPKKTNKNGGRRYGQRAESGERRRNRGKAIKAAVTNDTRQASEKAGSRRSRRGPPTRARY